MMRAVPMVGFWSDCADLDLHWGGHDEYSQSITHIQKNQV
jgi:hypothetical protein